MDKLLIWGTGGNALNFIEKIDLEKAEIVAFIDNDKNKHGKKLQGKPIISPSQIHQTNFSVLIICSTFHKEIKQQVEMLGIDKSKITSSPLNTPSLLKKFGKQSPYDTLSTEQLQILESVEWYHSFELFPGVKTPGRARWTPQKLNYFEAENNAQGKTVLDIGAWDGPYTFEMERRGAKVTAFDIQDPNRSGFYTAHSIIGSSANYIRGSVYDLHPDNHGTYDIVLFLGVYYHLHNPLQAFSNIYSVLKPGGLLIYEGAILDGASVVDIDGYWSENKDLLKICLNTPFCYFCKGNYHNDWSNWSVPTAVCLRDWLESTGFDVLALDKNESNTRAYGAARKIDTFDLAEHQII